MGEGMVGKTVGCCTPGAVWALVAVTFVVVKGIVGLSRAGIRAS